MSKAKQATARNVALAASATLLAVALPSSVFAIGMLSGGDDAAGSANRFTFTPASADPAMAELIASRSGGEQSLMRFTPAGISNARPDRSVTVAVRIDGQTASALSTGSGISASRTADAAAPGLRVTPTRYNLGIARGYGSFAQAPAAPAAPSLSRTLSDAAMPDISAFTPTAGKRDEPSRFAARVQLDEERPVARRADAANSVSDQLLEVNGSYRLTRNLDITAGVRYEQDRDLAPLPDLEQQDSQAAYVGPRFRF